MKIAIVGSTSQIARALALQFNNDEVIPYSRSLVNIPRGFVLEGSDYPIDLDLIINCVGNGNPNKSYNLTYQDLEDYIAIDEHILQYLKVTNPNAKYVYMSSWVADQDAPRCKKQEAYAVYKRFFEIRHEVANCVLNNRIMDVRIRSFFSRFLPVDGGYLISSIIRNAIHDEPFNLVGAFEPFCYTTPRSLWSEIRAGLNIGTTMLTPSVVHTTRSELYRDMKDEISSKSGDNLSSEFRTELSKLLEMYYARPEIINNDVIGSVSFDYETKENG